jgi:hypothetical protein
LASKYISVGVSELSNSIFQAILVLTNKDGSISPLFGDLSLKLVGHPISRDLTAVNLDEDPLAFALPLVPKAGETVTIRIENLALTVWLVLVPKAFVEAAIEAEEVSPAVSPALSPPAMVVVSSLELIRAEVLIGPPGRFSLLLGVHPEPFGSDLVDGFSDSLGDVGHSRGYFWARLVDLAWSVCAIIQILE